VESVRSEREKIYGGNVTIYICTYFKDAAAAADDDDNGDDAERWHRRCTR